MPKFGAQLGIVYQEGYRRSESDYILGRDKEAINSMTDNFTWAAPTIKRHSRQSAGHRLCKRHPEAFKPGGKHEQLALLKDVPWLFHNAFKNDTLLNSKVYCLLLECRAFRTVANNVKPPLAATLQNKSKGPQEKVKSLLGNATPHRQDVATVPREVGR